MQHTNTHNHRLTLQKVAQRALIEKGLMPEFPPPRRAGCYGGHHGHTATPHYTPAQIFPLLPEKLFTDVTLLNPGVDRLAMVVDMRILAR